MSNFKLVLLEEAITEIADSCSYYDDQVIGLGDKLENEIVQLLELIATNPNLFPVKFANVREAALDSFPFVITYEVFGKEIIVSAVFHTKQNPHKKTLRKRK